MSFEIYWELLYSLVLALVNVASGSEKNELSVLLIAISMHVIHIKFVTCFSKALLPLLFLPAFNVRGFFVCLFFSILGIEFKAFCLLVQPPTT